jgi:acetyltransferase-like isoleucine patch superfamily enzyme
MSLKDLARRGLRRLVTELAIRMVDAQAAVAERTMPEFANRPEHLTIDLPRRIINPERISLGDHVWLGPGSFIVAVKQYPGTSLRHPDKRHDVQSYSSHIRIGHRVTSSGSLVIGAAQRVEIGDDVLLAMNVTILDNLHGYENAEEPYKYQPLQRIAPVEVGRGCWIGQNVVILPSVKIGEMSIIGANSVVTHSIPERSIAVGAPARVIKQWDDKSREWRPYHNHTARSVRANLR